MQPQKPAGISSQDSFNKSIARVLAGNVSPGNGVTFDAQNYPLTFSTDNWSCVVIRVGSAANPNALPNSWVAPNTDLLIPHTLGKVPWAVFLVGKFAPADVYFGSVPPTAKDITLQCTVTDTDTTLIILG